MLFAHRTEKHTLTRDRHRHKYVVIKTSTSHLHKRCLFPSLFPVGCSFGSCRTFFVTTPLSKLSFEIFFVRLKSGTDKLAFLFVFLKFCTEFRKTKHIFGKRSLAIQKNCIEILNFTLLVLSHLIMFCSIFQKKRKQLTIKLQHYSCLCS